MSNKTRTSTAERRDLAEATSQLLAVQRHPVRSPRLVLADSARASPRAETQRITTGTNELGNVGFSTDVIVTNTVPITAYRGAGRPEAAAAIEQMVDRFAAEVGMDPAEVCSRNLVPKFTEPQGTFPDGAHVAVVEVDPETGGTTLVRLVAADDAGTLINPMLAEGQVHAGRVAFAGTTRPATPCPIRTSGAHR